MLYLLDKDVRTVRWNGEPLHEATSAIVKETMNGDFTLTVKYPISDSGIYQLIQEDMLIKAPTPVLGAQLFRIKKPVEHNDHLEITAYHISDDVMQRSITPVSVTSQSCGMALSRMVQNTKTALGDFSFNSDIQDRRTFNTTETETLYSVLLDGKHSIVGTWEGELVRDNFAMTIKKSRGENRGVVITTHKNLKDYQRTRNSQNVVTRIHAKSTFKPEGAEKETTIRVTVDSPLINSYPYINEKEYENNNAKTVEELQKWAQAKFTNQGIDKVSDAIKIEAYELDGQVVHIGDTVNLKSWKHNADVFKKAVAYEFDALKEEYISLTFDDKAGTGGSRASGGLSSAADAIIGVTESAQEIALEKALQNADLGFDHQAGLLRQEIADGIELAKAKSEEVKRELSDTIDQRFNSFDNGPMQDVKHRVEEALRNAGASSLLAQEAKRIGLDSVAKLEEFKRQTFNTQSALSWNLDTLKRTVISEVNQASEYRRTTTEALSRMTGQMNGFATKSEVAQGIDGLTQTFAKMKIGGRNLIRNYDWDKWLPLSSFSVGWKFERVEDQLAKSGYILKATCTKAGNGGFYKTLFDLRSDEFQGKDMTWSWDMKSSRPITFYDMGFEAGGLKKNVSVSTEWERISSAFKVAFNRFYSCVFYANGWEVGDVVYIRDPQLEEGTVATTPRPAPEDGKDEILAAKTEFKQTADGLSTRMATVENYVNQDGQRQDALQRYTREESARQVSAVREQISREYVGKSTYQEDVRGIERKFEGITNPKNGSIATQIADYKNSVDGRFTEITLLLSGKANQTDFQRVKETSQLYERILGNTNNSIADNVARMALTNQLFQVEVAKASSSGRNLFLNSLFKRDLRDKYSTYKLYDDNTQTKGQLAVSIDSENQFRGVNTLKIVSTFNGKIDNQKITFAIGGNSRTGRDDELKNKSVRFSFWAKSTVPNTKFLARTGYRGTLKELALSTDWQFYDIEFIRNENSNATSELILHVFSNATVWIAFPKIEIGTVSTPFSEAPEDTDEAIRSVQSQLAGSWAVQNINSAGDLISGLNFGANGYNRLDGKLTHITGETQIDNAVIKSAMVGKLKTANFEAGSVTTVVLDAEAVTADKVRMDQAFANKLVASNIFTDTLAAKEAFINKLRSVVVTATLLEGYKGRIGGFQIGTHDKDSSTYWITGQNHFSVGMSNGSGPWNQTALWVNWGNDWGKPSDTAWFVKNTGQMFCYNRAEFWNTPVIHGDLRVTGDIYYNNKASGGGSGYWISSPKYSKIEPSGGHLYLYYSGGGYDWIPMNKDVSDRRYKHNIEASTVSGLDVVESLKTYSYRKEYDGTIEDIACGIMAQDVQKYIPEAFLENPDGAYSYRTFELVPYLIKAIQELNQKIEKLEKTA